ncbi:hypothetical protein PR048_023690, partial [Dryococelus australis]
MIREKHVNAAFTLPAHSYGCVLIGAERGCPATVVRLWHTIDKPPLELCGEKRSSDKWQYLSEGNSMRI